MKNEISSLKKKLSAEREAEILSDALSAGIRLSHLLRGKVYVPKQLEYRRLADAQFGCIHPCCSFPLTDLVLQVPAAK